MSVYTDTKATTDHGSREGVKPSLIVLHHAAMTGSIDALVNLMMPGGRTVSAHAAIKDREIVSVVPESRRSYSLGAAVFERRVLSAECVNSTAAPNWLLSSETHESIAQWVADVSMRHGITPHRDGLAKSWTVIGHREAYTIHGAGYATACPGGMRLDWIVDRAQQIIREKTQPKEQDMRNFVNTATYVSGKAVKGTKAMTVFGDGTYVEYLRDPANPVEPAKLFMEAVGSGHKELTGKFYDALKGELRPRPTAPVTGGGTVDLGPVLDAVAKIPTAEQNGAAARAAIVKP